MRKRQKEAGIALLIAIFVLLLIAVVAIALVVSSGTESALAGNYRSSPGVYYAALAGVEEARARLRPNDPNSFKTWAAFYPAPGASLPIGTVGYVLNPGPNDTLGNMLATYPDNEYDTEFGPGAYASATKPTTSSVWASPPLNGVPFPGPLYKWVRINAVSEKSLNLDVDADGLPDSITPLYYDSVNRVFSNNPNAGPQALELTALAYLPNGSQKLLQYLVASVPIPLPPLVAALTLSDSPGNNATFHAPGSNNSYFVQGNDYDCNGGGPTGAVAAIGVFMSSDVTPVVNGIQPTPPGVKTHYTGWQGPAPDV